MEIFFKSDSYSTPIEKKRVFWDRLFLNSRFYFVLKYLQIVFKNAKVARKGLYDTEKWSDSSYDVFKLIEDCGGRFEISGIDNIRNTKEPVVFISNHMSTLETMVFPCIIAPLKEVTFVVKDSLVKHPVFGPIMRSRNPIVVSRANTRDDLKIVLNDGKNQLSNNISIILFPQSTRKPEFIPEEFNSLGVKLALNSGVKVIPVAIKTDFWGNGKLVKDLGKINRKNTIYMKFAPPMTIEGTGKEEHKKIIDYIQTNLEIFKDN